MEKIKRSDILPAKSFIFDCPNCERHSELHIENPEKEKVIHCEHCYTGHELED